MVVSSRECIKFLEAEIKPLKEAEIVKILQKMDCLFFISDGMGRKLRTI